MIQIGPALRQWVGVPLPSCGVQADFRKTGHAMLGPDSHGGSSYWRIQAGGVFACRSTMITMSINCLLDLIGCLMYLDVWG